MRKNLCGAERVLVQPPKAFYPSEVMHSSTFRPQGVNLVARDAGTARGPSSNPNHPGNRRNGVCPKRLAVLHRGIDVSLSPIRVEENQFPLATAVPEPWQFSVAR